jgi:hypothetical protein
VRDRKLKIELAGESAKPPHNFGPQLRPRMTEAKWLTSDDAPLMLEYALGRISQRKLRLFAVACCRRLLPLLGDIPVPNLIETAERFADDPAEWLELTAQREAAARLRYNGVLRNALDNFLLLGNEDAAYAADSIARHSPWWALTPPVAPHELADLLRHIAGNPFRFFPRGDALPDTACQLAEALYAGEDCAFALRDALLEAGQVELAEHFQEKSHPKGCWAVDLLLGKT